MTLIKLSFGLLLALVVYLIYLDTKVTRKFEGQKWQIPAQIYAKPQRLTNGSNLSKADLIEVLQQLNYRKVTRLSGPGEYVVSQDHLSLVRRAFDFAAGSQPELWLIVEFTGDKIHNVINRQTQKLLNEAYLEPLLIERLLSPHQQDREFLPLESFPELFKDTLLLVEDRDFYHHHGVSLTAILRALWHNIRAGRTVQGGSTLTQQLAKNFYLNHKRTLWRKVNEAFIALLLDYRYGKDQILEAYVNEVFLGQFHNRSIHGFGLASYYYFSKPINELKAQEFALLTAIIKGPSYYNPHKYTKRIGKRRDLILRMMFEHHLLDQQEYQQAVAAKLGISAKKQFLPLRYPAYIAQVKRDLRQSLTNNDIFADGIRVFTHLDVRLQQASELAIKDQLPEIEKRHQLENTEAAMISVDIDSAGISAMVGSKNVAYSGLNRVTDMKRNIGSLIKPAIFLQALSQPKQYQLATLLEDKPITLLNRHGKRWSPHNFDRQHQGQVSMLDALVRSKNIPTVNLGMALGVNTVIDGLRKLGVKADINRYPSLFLGALELSPLEVAQMYTTLADRGVYKPLSTLVAVSSNQGELIWQRSVRASANFSMPAVYLVNHGLQKVTQSGTARALDQWFKATQLAGKTGTTDDLRDSWFTGFDNDTLTTVWLGKDDYSPVGLTATQGALHLFAQMHRQVAPVSIVDIVPEQIEHGFFSVSNGLRLPAECNTGVNLPYIVVNEDKLVQKGC